MVILNVLYQQATGDQHFDVKLDLTLKRVFHDVTIQTGLRMLIQTSIY